MSKIDNIVAKFFHEIYLWGGEFANNFMKIVSLLAELGILFLLIGAGFAIFKRTRKIGATILFSVAIGFVITNLVLKPLISRARPFENIGTDYYKWWLDAGMTKESGHSFPSGHTTATTAFAVAIFLTTNKKYSWSVLFLPVLMASSRIYLMVHYFSDCLGGLAVGILSGIIAWLIVMFVYKSKLKLFVWIKEFDVFELRRPQKRIIKTEQAVAKPVAQENEKPEEFVYVRQVDESTATNLQPTEATSSDESTDINK